MKQYMNLSDQALVRLYMTGCDEAFDVILQRYKDKLYSYLLFTVKNEELADDLFQETFIKVILTLRQGRYTESGYFYSWLTRIARNLAIDHFRQGSSVTMVREDNFNFEKEVGGAEESLLLDSEYISEHALLEVKALMEHLPDNQKEVVFLRFYQELSFKEIAALTGVSINTSLGRMRYALNNLRRLAEGRGMSPESLLQ